MKPLKYSLLTILLVSIGVILGWWGKYEYEKAECIRDHDNCYLLKKGVNKVSPTAVEIDISVEEDYRCESVISTNPLIVQVSQNGTVNCDSASSSLELNFCSGVKACLEQKKMDSLNNYLLTIYDRLIEEQKEQIVDYTSVKRLQIESILRFAEYVDLEVEIVGIERKTGSLRIYYENSRMVEMLQSKNLELLDLIDDHE